MFAFVCECIFAALFAFSLQLESRAAPGRRVNGICTCIVFKSTGICIKCRLLDELLSLRTDTVVRGGGFRELSSFWPGSRWSDESTEQVF